MNYYERHIGDYLKDTSHLSLMEHGIYTRLLDVYYTREGAIPDDQVARLIGARSKDEREALQAVLNEFFQRTADGWVQTRCEREIERFKDKQDKARRSADARWSAHRPQSERNANASANAMRTHSEGNAPRARPQSPDTSLQTPIPENQRAGTREVVPRAPGAEACIRMKAAGLQAVNPSHPKLLALLDAGITPDELAHAAGEAVAKGKGFAYALATAEGRRRDAATPALPDRASVTVPGPGGPDPTLARLDAERAAWRPPAPEVKAMLRDTVARLKGAAA